jgi:predicted MFS family arabinose efflux permease
MRAMPFFLGTGFAFILAENGLFLMISLFIGGPLYALTIVLPSLLIGYGMGSLVALQVAPATRRGAFRLMLLYVFSFAVLFAIARWVLPALMGVAMESRLLVAVAFILPFGVVLGLGTPWYMEILKVRSAAHRCIAWMWGVSAAANVVGSLLFVPLCNQMGVGGVFLFAGLLYLLALTWAVTRPPQRSVLQAIRPSA